MASGTRPEDFERYEAGELVVPIKPIIFYVDRQTPEYLRSSLHRGCRQLAKSI